VPAAALLLLPAPEDAVPLPLAPVDEDTVTPLLSPADEDTVTPLLATPDVEEAPPLELGCAELPPDVLAPEDATPDELARELFPAPLDAAAADEAVVSPPEEDDVESVEPPGHPVTTPSTSVHSTRPETRSIRFCIQHSRGCLTGQFSSGNNGGGT